MSEYYISTHRIDTTLLRDLLRNLHSCNRLNLNSFVAIVSQNFIITMITLITRYIYVYKVSRVGGLCVTYRRGFGLDDWI
jgi:hypothetical protein